MPTANPTLQTLHAAALASSLVTASQWSYIERLARHRLAVQQDSSKPEGYFAAGARPAAAPDHLDPRYLADLMIEQGWMTAYQADQLLAGRSKLNLGPYVITDWIGQGGMGQVFKATHRFMQRQCAVKVLPTAKTTEESLHAFMREIRTQALLDHPHLVRAYDAGQDGNVHYLVTEYVPGMDLRRLVKSRGALTAAQASAIIMQAALGLQYAHGAGLVHRDVKPGNILVTPEGIAKVSDIGLAGFAADLSADPRSGKIVGTADYIAPEQIRSPTDVTPASDVYSLGCTLYYAVCGKVPFPGGNAQSKLKRQLAETPWHPRKFAPALSDEFVDIIADMMEKDATRRTQTCAEVAARLEAWASEPAAVPAQSWPAAAWAAPPPPADAALEPDEPSVAAGVTDTGQLEQSNTHASAGPPMIPQGSTGPVPHPPHSSASELAEIRRHRPPAHAGSQTVIILLTVAIAVPPALLLGFILGYLLAG